MLSTNNLKTNLKLNMDSAFYETDDLKFYYSELMNIEEIIVENEFVNLAFSTEKENPNFTTKSLDVYYRLTFKENNGNLKTYDIDHKPKHLGHKYFYIVQDNKIVRIFYHKETMIDILDKYYTSEKNFDKGNILDGKFNNFLCKNIKITSTISTILMCGFFILSLISLFSKSSSFIAFSWILLFLSFICSGLLLFVSNKKDKFVEVNRKKEIEELLNSL
ncbi:hypothetical protein ACTOJ1_001741 [Shigella flexneri]